MGGIAHHSYSKSQFNLRFREFTITALASGAASYNWYLGCGSNNISKKTENPTKTSTYITGLFQYGNILCVSPHMQLNLCLHNGKGKGNGDGCQFSEK
jgi:hypothetical protein